MNTRTVITLVTLSFSVAASSPAGIVKSWDCEGDNPLQGLNMGSKDYHPVIVPDPSNPSNKVMCVTHSKSSPRPERAEVQGDRIHVGDDRWVGARIMKPDLVPKTWTCFFQIGPIWGAPGKGRAGLYQLDTLGDATWHIRGWMGRAGRRDFMKDIGPLRYGQWYSFVFHVKLRADKSGLFEVWKDGVKVLTDNGQNAWNGDEMRIQWGVYHGPAEKDIRCYYDDIVIGDASSSYEEVAPKTKRGSSSLTPLMPRTTIVPAPLPSRH